MAQFHQWCLSQVCLQLVGPWSTERSVVYSLLFTDVCCIFSFSHVCCQYPNDGWGDGWYVPWTCAKGWCYLSDGWGGWGVDDVVPCTCADVDATWVMGGVCGGERQQPSPCMRMSKQLQAVCSSYCEIPVAFGFSFEHASSCLTVSGSVVVVWCCCGVSVVCDFVSC